MLSGKLGSTEEEDRRGPRRENERVTFGIAPEDLNCESLSHLVLSTFSQMLVGSRLLR